MRASLRELAAVVNSRGAQNTRECSNGGKARMHRIYGLPGLYTKNITIICTHIHTQIHKLDNTIHPGRVGWHTVQPTVSIPPPQTHRQALEQVAGGLRWRDARALSKQPTNATNGEGSLLTPAPKRPNVSTTNLVELWICSNLQSCSV